MSINSCNLWEGCQRIQSAGKKTIPMAAMVMYGVAGLKRRVDTYGYKQYSKINNNI